MKPPLTFWAVQAKIPKLGFDSLHFCMEATGVYFEPLAEYLNEVAQSRPWIISVVKTARISAYAKSKLQRGKTNQADAALIAQFCQKQHPEAWQPVPVELKQLHGFTCHPEALKQD
jgi:transposase